MEKQNNDSLRLAMRANVSSWYQKKRGDYIGRTRGEAEEGTQKRICFDLAATDMVRRNPIR